MDEAMTPLSDALTAAQRSALAALEKAYVSGSCTTDQFTDGLESCGITDAVDIVFLLAALNVLREWGVSAPTMTERVTRENGNEPASDKQKAFITRLLGEKNIAPTDMPDGPFTKGQASELIDQLQDGTYDAEKWRVPF
jgi:hypothetical protein